MSLHHTLAETAVTLVAKGRGILAADESTGTLAKRFDSIQLANTEENRRAYRNLLFRTRGFGKSISGVILYDETLRQKAPGSRTFLRELIEKSGALPGIKVDKGLKILPGFPNETFTEGFDGLRERLAEYAALGAKFTKWRAVIDIDAGRPSAHAVQVNAEALARYAALAQEAGLVPIVEPEVLMDGAHDLARCAEVTEHVLAVLYAQLHAARVHLEGTLLKPNMVIAGKKSPVQASPAEVAAATLRVLRRTVPAAVPGVVFLSGGQSEVQATEHLHLINAAGPQPWALSFSYGRALQAGALKAWAGKADNVAAAQEVFAHRAHMNVLAARGKWSAELEAAA